MQAAVRKYRRKTDSYVTAVQLNLDTEGFTYRKWGALQTCRPGDWIVENAGDTYTVSRDSFAKTYRQLSPGVYVKFAEVYAIVAVQAGTIQTQEGSTDYYAGDYLVYNNPDLSDGYAVSKARFEALYEPVES